MQYIPSFDLNDTVVKFLPDYIQKTFIYLVSKRFQFNRFTADPLLMFGRS